MTVTLIEIRKEVDMTGHRSFNDLCKRTSPERRTHNDESTKAMLQEMALHELRQAREKPNRTWRAHCT
jgi:hypothetical protein